MTLKLNKIYIFVILFSCNTFALVDMFTQTGDQVNKKYARISKQKKPENNKENNKKKKMSYRLIVKSNSLMSKFKIDTSLLDSDSTLYSQNSFSFGVDLIAFSNRVDKYFLTYNFDSNHFLNVENLTIKNTDNKNHQILFGRKFTIDKNWNFNYFFDLEQLLLIKGLTNIDLQMISPWAYGIGVGVDFQLDLTTNTNLKILFQFIFNPSIKLKDVKINKSSSYQIGGVYNYIFGHKAYQASLFGSFLNKSLESSLGNFISKNIKMGIGLSKVF